MGEDVRFAGAVLRLLRTAKLSGTTSDLRSLAGWSRLTRREIPRGASGKDSRRISAMSPASAINFMPPLAAPRRTTTPRSFEGRVGRHATQFRVEQVVPDQA